MNTDSLSRFHPLVARWFAETVGRPTNIQAAAWEKIARNEHVLVSAPTGSGKTFTAFLWAINQFMTGDRQPGHTSLLYVSPLKALNNDIRRNLISPIGELREIALEEGDRLAEIRVLTRSGDTPQPERRRMVRRPPEILITTPESLNLLLSSAGGRSILTHITTVILDEVHALADTKRGVHLMTAVERLVLLSGEFQRIALSATVRPMETIAAFIGGYRTVGSPGSPSYEPREVTIISDTTPKAQQKRYDIEVRSPDKAVGLSSRQTIWDLLVGEFRRIVEGHRSTLIFTNSRRLCEKLAYMINAGNGGHLAYAHHGSLSREIREDVEKALKEGRLKTIVATSSLELGIDIGSLDSVVLVQSPPSVSSAIQRLGRSGHHVGETSTGTIFPTHPTDIIEAAALVPAILDQNIEARTPIQCPLDVLSQVIISMTGVERWDIDELYHHIQTSYPYRHLSRRHFDLVLNMLGGRYAGTRIRELQPQVSIDRIDNTVKAKKAALLRLYMSGGTIPDRGYYVLRHFESGARIGELDEEFVWEARIGETFTLGTQNWTINRLTSNDVFVAPGNPRATAPPFWKAEEYDRDFHYSDCIASFLESADARISDRGFADRLMVSNHLDANAAGQLVDFLREQKQKTGSALPHRHHVLVEHIPSGPAGATGNQVVIHTFWGGRVNRPLAMALEAAWEDRFQQHIEIHATNDCIVLLLPHDVSGTEVFSMVPVSKIESLLRQRLESSGFFGARFREAAGRSLLLTKRRISERMPLWLTRLQSQRLLEAVSGYDDFPILLEAWRSSLTDTFDLESLRMLLTELSSGTIALTEVRSRTPSPMARHVSWQQINRYVYMDDSRPDSRPSQLSRDLLRDLVQSADLRPAVSQDTIDLYEEKRQRLYPGYTPRVSEELLDWIKERLIVPRPEWSALCSAIRRDHGVDASLLPSPLSGKVVWLTPAGGATPLMVAREYAGRVVRTLFGPDEDVAVAPFSRDDDTRGWDTDTGAGNTARGLRTAPDQDGEEGLAEVIWDWMQFYGPRQIGFIREALGIGEDRLNLALDRLVDSGKTIVGPLVASAAETDLFFCDAESYESLLRLKRIQARPAFQPLHISYLAPSLAGIQGIVGPGSDTDALIDRIEQLLCYEAPSDLWEKEVLPARLMPYDTSWLDSIMQETDLMWIGAKTPGKHVERRSQTGRIAFSFEPDLDLMERKAAETGDLVDSSANGNASLDEGSGIRTPPGSASELFPQGLGRFDFYTLLRSSGLGAQELSARLWSLVWQGEITNDTFVALRRGIENSFKLPDESATIPGIRTRRRPRGRSRFSKWKGSLPSSGYWYPIAYPGPPEDHLESIELRKERVRILLDRYGILFRELLLRELPAFRWSTLFRTLRIMELSGEVLTGYFFHGIPGPQFVSHHGLRRLQQAMPGDDIYWINAMDPASLCGIGLDSLKGKLPKRLAGSHLVYRGGRLALVSTQNGRSLTFHVGPDDPDLDRINGVLHHLLSRKFQPMRQVTIDSINGDPAAASAFVPGFHRSFDVVTDVKTVILYRKRA